MEFFRRCSRLTRFEEDLVAQSRRLVEEAFALGERISFQVSRATGDAVVDGYQSIFSPAPLAQSPSLATSQDDEVLASSALSQEQHTCEETSETQGPEHTHDSSFDLVPESSSSALPGLAAALSSTPPLSSSQDISAHSPQLAEQQISREDKSDAQGPEQKHDASEAAVPAALDYELVSSALLASNGVSSLLHERGLFGGAEGALPVGGEESSDGEEGSGNGGSQELVLAEPSEAACSVEELEGGEVDHGVGAGGAICTGRGQGSTIQDLDALCLLRIMGCLGNSSLQACSLVCREWLDISNHSRDCLTMRGDLLVFTLPKVLPRFPNLQTVHLLNIVKSSESNQKFSWLAGLVDDSLELLAKSCPSLVRLTLVRCGVVSDKGLVSVLRGCTKLRKLGVDHCEGFSGAAFEGVQCSLEELSLHYCSGVTSTGVGAVAAACPSLRVFTLRMEGGVANLEAGLKRVALFCSGLEKITMIACGITDSALRRFAVDCPLLADVCIADEPGITDAGVFSLQVHLRHLARLTLSGNRQLLQVPRSGRFLRLKDMGVARFLHTPDEMLRQLSKEADLEELRLVGCPALTDASIGNILVGCCNLKRLLIADCELVTPGIFQFYKESGNKANLEIKRCKGVRVEMLPEQLRLSGKVFVVS